MSINIVFIVRVLFFLNLLFLFSCSILPKQGKISEIENAYEAWLKTSNPKGLKGLNYKVKYCGGICSGSITGKYYVNIFSNACNGRVNIEEMCSDENMCIYTFEENPISICS